MNLDKIDWVSVSISIILSFIGILTLYGGGGQGEALAIKKIIWLLLGLLIMFALAYVNYQVIGSYAPLLFGIGIFLLVITLIPFIGTKVKGARSWIRFFGFGFQPAEFMKLALVITLCKYLVYRETEIGKFKELFIPFLITAFPLLLLAAQPDLGYAILFLPILFVLLFIGGANIAVITGFAIVGFSALFIPMFIEYQRFIMVDDLVDFLKENHFKLADAIRILKFEVWQFADNPALAVNFNGSSLEKWSVSILTKPENLKIFHNAVASLEAEHPSFIRDFMRNNLAIFLTTIVSLIFYGLGLLGNFMTGKIWMKRASTFFIILALAISGTFAFKTFVKFKPHQVVRVVSFANPDKFSKDAGYQLRHSLITLGSGQLAGKGFGKSDMTRGEVPFLPEWYNDFIFSVIGEQFGVFGTIITLLLLFGLVFRGITIAIQSKDDYGALLASGITAIFFLHILINTGITMGLFPVTGIPLPFVSYGGSNMISSFAALGILQNINRRRHINA